MQLEQTPITVLKGVGAKLAEKLQRLDITTLQDLLFHLPLRYEDRTHIWPISDLMSGVHVCVCGIIDKVDTLYARRRILSCRINDGSGALTLVFFNFNQGQKKAMQPGLKLRAYGEIRRGKHGWEIVHPDYHIFDSDETPDLNEQLTPVYPTTEGLRQISLRQLSEQALKLIEQYPPQPLIPEQTGLLKSLPHLDEALKLLHQPAPDTNLADLEDGSYPPLQRLVIEELCAHQLSLLTLRQQAQRETALVLPPAPELEQQFLSRLGFSPTHAQRRVASEISHDLSQSWPMMRLVQGDVGSGKTLVAALAALHALAQGQQVALMAPTEILAEQHLNNFTNWLTPLGFTIDWLAGKQKAKAREEALARIASGQTQMVIGTHAIFQDQVAFAHLALVIIDEQHRFGVHQRLALREKGTHGFVPHQLVMTATPIPRTLAMTAYADLSLSIIDELPPGRTPVTTVVVPDTRREEVITRVHQACQSENRQAYWVCTLIEESEALQCQAAEDTAAQLQEQLPQLRIGLVHGRMKAQEKQWVMDEFKAHRLDLLVATTVIEVGVDVPNASLMIIENPERLGLAQLHQLRGRVGRGQIASHCVLLYHSPLSKTATARLSVLRDSNDGFVIAERDLEIRGPGEMLGTRQTGLVSFKIADLIRDQALLAPARELANQVLSEHPALVKPLIRRWLGHRDKYVQA
ncbi:ATP-dependent DNA helicase RecG [Celerinatantimonas diazotrophica]|uniref:ATP-dependent DNA helicase RecG n=1 Tax=Celerinatantimonas diazotrophica TaxID=412034 RepID=A0A4R1KF41_9GAMM|nr:ATP-dependent DNA helicase RecG [Celerinatantimonas diazotrophica]TCK63296.1 ATP-dependent DNA helicase RecG [Celerinatantimonas diazotrophica]CAG9298440.1 ATP-dependent DNA helicase RecG [Celerinatantimonas diazotrophica]